MRRKLYAILVVTSLLLMGSGVLLVWSWVRESRDAEELMALWDGVNDVSLQTTTVLPDWINDSTIDWLNTEWLQQKGRRISSIQITTWSFESSQSDSEKIVRGLRMLGRHRHLESLELNGPWLTDARLSEIPEIPSLTLLSVTDTSLTKASLSTIARHRNLTCLSLSSLEEIDDSALKELRPLQQLESIDFALTTFSWGPGIRDLACLPRLARIGLKGTSIVGHPDGAFYGLAQIESLKSIGITGSGEILGNHIRRLARLPNLQELNLSDNKARGWVSKDFGLKQLQSLGLVNVEGPVDRLFTALVAGGRLRSVSVRNTRLGDAGIAALASSRSLEWLDLQESDVGDSGLSSLIAQNRLRSLQLSRSRVQKKGFRFACRHFPLQFLYAAHLDLEDDDLMDLPSLTGIQFLDLSHNRLTDAGTPSLASLPRLHELNICHNQLTDAGLAPMSSLKNIRCCLDGNKVTAAGIVGLESATAVRTSGHQCGNSLRRITCSSIPGISMRP